MWQTAFRSVHKILSVSSFMPAQGEPLSALCGPVERGYVLISLARRCTCPERTAGGLSRTIELQGGFMPLRDRSGLSSQPFWHGVRGRSGRSLFKVHWNLSPPQVHTHSTHIFNEICLGFLIRLGFSGFVPSIGFPVHLFPFTFVFLFSFMSSCLHVWSSHPFFRLRTQVLALVCKCTTYLNLGFRSPRSL